MRRMIFAFIYIAVFEAVVFAAKPPKWVSDPKAVYPESKYLARTGRGATEEMARVSALAAISGYFKTQVAASTKANSKMSENNGSVNKQRAINQEIQIQTEMDLIAVDYSEIYFDKKKKEYHVCAFIDRALAWNVIEADVIKYANEYASLYDKALTEKEEILRYKYLQKSRAAGDELITRLYFGFLINSNKQIEFKEKIDEISNDAIFATLDTKSIPLYLSVSGDQDGIAASALNEIFGSLGFVVSMNKSSSQKYSLNMSVVSNEQWNEDGGSKMVAIFPNVLIKLVNIATGEEFYTWSKSYGRVSNFSVEKAMQRALKNNIVPDIKNIVANDYRQHFLSN